MPPDHAPSPPLPRSRNADRTRADILRAACRAFSVHGYAQATVRQIASDAGINVALIVRYFGSKEGLFDAALMESLDIERLIAGDRNAFGERLAQLLTDASEDSRNPLAMMLLATSDTVARTVVLKRLTARVTAPLARWLRGRDACERAVRITMLSSGYLTYQLLLPIPDRSVADVYSTREWLAKALQDQVDCG
ncbi:TetR/AcrR family transcriptional regulator [Pseudomonas sp. NY15436]|uniref:TetR/AcrR family transcriptional regulator n=1 Tax=Pseudomonas TaxID=286 RepID=UPI001E52F823|nr:MULTISPECIES: TetR/AcrR family transcriptional regulator [Pseudomonas]MCE4071452.1 TetR family transcriptional regulator [Pseudomonas nitritireducens]MCE4081228.1 TetR family transcriptional regulator [Pseudomonas nitroreducens]